jgi:hypothetical protein
MSHTESDLIEAARGLRELIDADTFPQVTIEKRRAGRLRDLLHQAANTIASMTEVTRQRDGRISRLESANGALMVDRDDTRTRAAIDVAAARDLVVRHLGIDSPELDKRLREQAEYSRRVLTLVDSERTAYDQFRMTVVGLMQEIGDRESLDGEQLAKVRGVISRANKRAMGY